MHIINSIALTDDDDRLGASFATGDSYWTIGLEDNTLHVLDADGQVLYVLKDDTSDFKGPCEIVIKDSSLVMSWAQSSSISIFELTTGKLSSVTTLERDPGKLIPFPSDPSTLVVVSSLSQLHLFSISEPAKKLDLSLDLTSIAPYDCFKYHLAHSLLALLCSDGIIHILSLSEPPNSRIPKLQSLCTLFSLPKPPPLYESNKERRIASEEEKAAQMYSVLVVSPKRVLTGHRDGKIRVFDISRARNAALSDASMRASSSMAEGLQQINTPTCVVQAHRQNRGVVNSMLALPSQDDALSYRLVSTGTDGFAKVWSLHPQSSSSPSSFQTDTLLLLVSIKLFDHAITCRSLSEHGQWLFVAGKDGGKEDNVCGLYNGIKAWKLPADGNGEVVVKKIGSPCPVVWDLAYVRGGKLFVSLMRRGKACAEVWDVRDLGE